MKRIRWKDVVGYEGYYQVSNTGQVKALPRTVTNKKGKSRKVKGCIIKQEQKEGTRKSDLIKTER